VRTLRHSLIASLALGACSGGSTQPTRMATALAFQVQPANATAGVPIAPSVQVRAVDSTGATATSFTGNVTVAFGANPGSGTLSGTTTVKAASGVATFSTITVDSAATGYTLAASSSGLAGATSGTFNVVLGPSDAALIAGNDQPGLVSFAVNDRPTVRVTDVHGTPVVGLSVTFAVASGGGSATGTATVTNANGVAQIGSWTLGGSAGVNTLSATIAGPAFPGNPAIFTDTAYTAGFPITIMPFGPGLTSAQAAFTAAVSKWRQIVYRPLSSVSLASVGAGACYPGTPALSGSTTGVVIYASVQTIDGAGGILAEAGPCVSRTTNGLAAVGVVIFDSADIGGLISNGSLNSVVLHEMGHVLGFGTAWGPPSGTVFANCLQLPSNPPGTLQDTYFSCPKAKAQFDSVGGGSYTGGNVVPVENCATSPYVYPACSTGTVNGHWREVAFGNELMVGFLPANPKLSVVTAAVLADLGYVVNYAGTDTYTHTFSERAPGGAAVVVPLGDDTWRGPRYLVGTDGALRSVPR